MPRLAVPILVPLLLSCGGAEDGGASFDNADFYTSAGLFHVLSTTDPDPPAAGIAVLELDITRAEDESPVGTDARVGLEVWEATEGTAISPSPMVGVSGEGHFVASWVYPRPGIYQVELSISDASGSDGAVLTYSVR